MGGCRPATPSLRSSSFDSALSRVCQDLLYALDKHRAIGPRRRHRNPRQPRDLRRSLAPGAGTRRPHPRGALLRPGRARPARGSLGVGVLHHPGGRGSGDRRRQAGEYARPRRVLRRDLGASRRVAGRGHRRDASAPLPRAPRETPTGIPADKPARLLPHPGGRGAQARQRDAEERLTERPHPPGDYPVVLVGSGPGGLQISYSLSRLGIRHAAISADEGAGGMFRRWPFFQRLLSWTKPYAPFERGSREYERYDWNSLLAEDQKDRALMTTIMGGTPYFPSRPGKEGNPPTFAQRAGLAVRYRTRWTGTRRDGDRWVLETSEGEYRCQVPIFAVGVAEPWRPQIPG